MKKILIFLCFLLILFNSDIIHSKVIPPKPKPNEYIDKSKQNTKKSKVDTNKDFNAKIKKRPNLGRFSNPMGFHPSKI